jgi:riboflavin kinase/FMN adenylyltransferase
MSDSQVNAVAVGMFDGVHLGHRAVLAAARRHAERLGGDVRVLTFDPHPRAIVGGQPPKMLATLDDRIALLRGAGADHVEVATFDDTLRSLEPEAFVDEWLVQRLAAGAVVVGAGFRFGNGARGDVDLLRRIGGAGGGFEVEAVELENFEGAPVSSTRVRQALEIGDVTLASRLLDRPWSIAGTVVHGAKRGRELGFPTANLGLDPALQVPGPGVYAGVGRALGQEWVAAISVGNNPQFTPESHDRTVEAFLLDYDEGEALYDERLELDFTHHVRGQGVWPTIDGLVEQMHRDVARIRELATA